MIFIVIIEVVLPDHQLMFERRQSKPSLATFCLRRGTKVTLMSHKLHGVQFLQAFSALSSATFSHTLFQLWLFSTVVYIRFLEYLFLFLESSVFYNVYFSLASPLFIYQLNFNDLMKMFLDSFVYILTVLNDCHLNFYLQYFAFVCIVMKQLHFHQGYKASQCNTRLGMVPDFSEMDIQQQMNNSVLMRSFHTISFPLLICQSLSLPSKFLLPILWYFSADIVFCKAENIRTI